MKFAEHLAAHITPEWRKQYILYEEMKTLLYNAVERLPSQEVADKDDIIRYIKAFDEDFFSFCEKELIKINTFFAEKLAESTRRFSSLKNELNLNKAKLNIAHNINLKSSKDEIEISLWQNFFDSKMSTNVSKEARTHIRKMHEIKLGFSEFYLCLVLIQNYQNLNYTGFIKILKKHDKLIGNEQGIKWRMTHVECAPFYVIKDIGKLIEETENLFTYELEEGDRRKAMKRLRVPPLNDQQSPWITFKVGFFSGAFCILIAVVLITTYSHGLSDEIKIAFRLYRSTFLIILFLFLIGMNVYGWRTSGVNHVLIFELDPRDHLSDQHLIEIAASLSVLWSLSVITFFYSSYLHIPPYFNPLVLIITMTIFLINPTPTFCHNARFWLLRVMGRILCAPFFKVNFADFWLADQLNSLVPVLTDLQYFVCFYSSIITSGIGTNWYVNHDLAKCLDGTKADIAVRTVIGCLPAWFRFAQCLRRYYDDNRGSFPHLINAGKYSTTFFVVIFSMLAISTQNSYNSSIENPFFLLWILSLVVSSCYTYIWDIKMDWGLFESSSDQIEYPFLREEIVYSSPIFYYIAIIEDLILRFGWTLSVSLIEIGIINADLMITILAPLEIFRRFIWNYFRLENEHLNNCGEFRAVRDISIAPIDAGDQAKLIKMMDDPNGVVNRRIKPTKIVSKDKLKFKINEMNKVD